MSSHSELADTTYRLRCHRPARRTARGLPSTQPAYSLALGPAREKAHYWGRVHRAVNQALTAMAAATGGDVGLRVPRPQPEHGPGSH